VIGAQRTHHRGLKLVSIHSFTPVYRGESRPWHIGVLSGEDRRMAEPLLKLLRADRRLHVGDNEPYAPTDGVYHTLDRHSAPHCDHSVLLEVRADLIETQTTREDWARRVAAALRHVDTK
jgi:predicted N-formylglutamate amidohydrolase